MKVLLLGNYPLDGQESMLRFAEVLKKSLREKGLTIDLIQPKPIIGKILRNKWGGYIDKYILFPFALATKIHHFDLIHICDHSNAIYLRYIKHKPHLLTCNDCLALRAARGDFPQHQVRWTGQFLQKWILRGINEANYVTCISKKTAQDLLEVSELKPLQVSVTYMGQNYQYKPMPSEEAVAKLRTLSSSHKNSNLLFNKENSIQPYILHVGNNNWYKNRMGVLEIYKQLRQVLSNPPQLIFAGKPFTKEMENFISANVLQEHILEFTRVDNDSLCALYSLARVLLFPSLEEGFGWPIVEALACGCPVVTSNRPPMTEIGGEAVTYGDPYKVDSFIDPIKEALTETIPEREKKQHSRIQQTKSFSTDKMIDNYLGLYHSILES